MRQAKLKPSPASEQKTPPEPARRGRRPRDSAESHEAILTAVYELLQDMPVCDLTMEQIAKRAGVGKPTLYRWWPSKAALVVTMFNERVVPSLNAAAPGSLEESLRQKIQRLIAAMNGFFGKVMAEMIAEGQSDPQVMKALNDIYILPRRALTANELSDAQRQGLVAQDADPELMVDIMFGLIYYNLLMRLRPLTPEYGDQLLEVGKRLLGIGEMPAAKSTAGKPGK